MTRFLSMSTQEDDLSKSIALCNVEANVVKTWIIFLENTWQFQSSYNEQKEKKTRYVAVVAVHRLLLLFDASLSHVKFLVRFIVHEFSDRPVLPFYDVICYGLNSDELERCVNDFLKLTKHHLSAFKVSLSIYHSIHALGYYVPILFCHM